MPQWKAPKRPIDHAEEALVSAFLDETFGPGDTLPGERELAGQLGVTRPTLREALRRLERDGWLTIQQGKSTRVNDFWREGGPNILTGIVRSGNGLPAGFVTDLLEARCVIAPAYIGMAVTRAPGEVRALLGETSGLPDSAEAYAAYDWRLHHELSVLGGNPIFTLILNGFAGFYEEVARRYFTLPEARQTSRRFYHYLQEAATAGDGRRAEEASREVMRRSIALWKLAKESEGR